MADFCEAIASAESRRLMEVRLDYGCVEIVCEAMETTQAGGSIIGVDLGVNTVITATDGEKAIT